LDNHLVKRKGKKEYKDDSRLMDIFSFPGYQVEIEVPTNPDGLSKPVILDKTLRGEVDPVILGKASVLVYEIPVEKKKLPADDWVDVKDLGMDDDTHPEDVGPVKMTTPASREKIWLASNVCGTSPVPYSNLDTTTAIRAPVQ
jgi:hypothetical protein